MFGKPKYNLEMIDTASKMSLKLSCLKASDNNVEKARELYEFLSSDIADIPDVVPVRPGAFEQVKQGTSEVIGWLSSHREDVAQGISFIQSLRKSVAPSPASVPPIPKI